MKIVFLCGSLEPGRDGVGDYTRRLAVELIRQGHECRMIALNDRDVKEGTGLDQIESQDGVRTLRLPAAASWSARIEAARQWSERFEPEWISLQFVPYSFHPKGLPFWLGKRLCRLVAKSNWHVMFHELWIGMHEGASLRQRLIGSLQRQIILQALKRLGIDRITTHSRVYMDCLKQTRNSPAHLPLFGNIPKVPVMPNCFSVKSTLVFVLFGGIQPYAPVAEFARDCSEFCQSSGRGIRLVLAGRCGAEQKRWKEAWLAEGLEIEITGELPAEEVSRLFQSASFGVATTPLALIEKSGAAAAMLEHSLRVINVAAEWIPRSDHRVSAPAGIYEYRPGTLAQIIATEKEAAIMGPSVEAVAAQLVAILR
jgi:hypothetical protein